MHVIGFIYFKLSFVVYIGFTHYLKKKLPRLKPICLHGRYATGYNTTINSIQFILMDLLTNKVTQTPIFGNDSGTKVQVNQANNAPNNYTFVIDTLNGSTDNISINTFSINYHYKECVQTTPLTNAITKSTLSILCSNFGKSSEVLGSNSSLSDAFSIPTTDLDMILIYSGSSIVAFQAISNDGSIISYGNPGSPSITSYGNVNLFKQSIIGINLSYTSVINSIQFVLMDSASNKISSSLIFGNVRGSQVSINQQNNAPPGYTFVIDALNGSTDDNYLRTFFVSFHYKECVSTTTTTSHALTGYSNQTTSNSKSTVYPATTNSNKTISITSIKSSTMSTFSQITTQDCSVFAQESTTFGSSSPSSIPFSISVSNLYQITIFSCDHLVAFQFYFLNGSSTTFGNPNNGLVTQINTINLSNSIIVGINLSYGVNINSIQFILTDKATNITSATSLFGHLAGTQVSINQANYAPHGFLFIIDSFSGAADGLSITLVSFSFHYKECILSTPKSSVASSIRSTAKSGQCPIYNKVSSVFGKNSPSSVPFSVPVSSLYQIVIFSCQTIIAIQFFYNDGSILFSGNPNNGLVTHVDTVNLYDQLIIGVYVSYDQVINSIQFDLLCESTNTIIKTPTFGIVKGTPVSINLANYAPSASSFVIDNLSGSANNSSLTTFAVNYYYTQCS